MEIATAYEDITEYNKAHEELLSRYEKEKLAAILERPIENLRRLMTGNHCNPYQAFSLYFSVSEPCGHDKLLLYMAAVSVIFAESNPEPSFAAAETKSP